MTFLDSRTQNNSAVYFISHRFGKLQGPEPVEGRIDAERQEPATKHRTLNAER